MRKPRPADRYLSCEPLASRRGPTDIRPRVGPWISGLVRAHGYPITTKCDQPSNTISYYGNDGYPATGGPTDIPTNGRAYCNEVVIITETLLVTLVMMDIRRQVGRRISSYRWADGYPTHGPMPADIRITWADHAGYPDIQPQVGQRISPPTGELIVMKL
jgi:hypothetical protein